MVDLLEILLLTQFVIGGTGFLGNDAGLVKLLLKDLELIGQLSILPIDLRDVGNLGQVKFALRFFLKPLLLEVFEGLLHSELNKEVAKEFIGQFNFSARASLLRFLLSLVFESMQSCFLGPS